MARAWVILPPVAWAASGSWRSQLTTSRVAAKPSACTLGFLAS